MKGCINRRLINMTAQAPDQFFYKEKRFDLAGIKGNGLFTPKDFKIEIRSASTACWRGYIMRYALIGTELILDGFWVNTKDENPPKINGLLPRKDHELKSLFKYEYTNLNLKIPFTGSIWVAKDFIESQYVHMGFQDQSAYGTVLRFDFENGDIVVNENVSFEAEDDRIHDRSSRYPTSDSSDDVKDWVDKRFSLDPDDR